MSDEVDNYVEAAKQMLGTESPAWGQPTNIEFKAIVGVGYAVLALTKAVQQAGEAVYDILDRRLQSGL